MNLDETSLRQLYSSAIRAFPYTMKRQYATDPLVVVEMSWIPYLGMKTLYISGRVLSEGKSYKTIILFKNVNYRIEESDRKAVKITASDGLEYTFEKLHQEDTDVLVRCDCPDFRWRFNFYNSSESSLYGRKATAYVPGQNGGPPANPLGMPGMCKHIIKTTIALKRSGCIT